jgi:subtilase family serine protease
MRSMTGRTAITGLACALACVWLGSADASAAARRAVGTAAPLPASTQVLGALSGSAQLHIAVALEPQDPAALARYATGVSTPGDPLYGEFLPVSQFASRFGATDAAIDAVAGALRAGGLSVAAASANRLMIDASGPASSIERLLSVQISNVRLSNGRAAFANTDTPTLPASIAAYVQGVIGLDTVYAPAPQGLVRRKPALVSPRVIPHAITSGPQPCSNASALATAPNNYGGTGFAYTADEIASMYGLASYYPGDEGAGQTVALVEEQPFAASDIAAFQACYGTGATVNTINVDGGPGAFTPGNPELGDDGESALDIEQVIGLAPKATIDVYQGPNIGQNSSSPSDILNAIVSQDQAKVISSSYGICEKLTPQSVINAENTELQEAAVQGQSFFISSGDSGSLMCYQATRGTNQQDASLSVIDPGAQPYATGVGGTTLGNVVSNTWVLPQNGDYPNEAVWNDGGADPSGDQASGTGGGTSDQWQMPSYQANAAGSLNVINSNSSKACNNAFCREVPDVSADADPNSGYAIYSTTGGATTGSWGGTGGTSAAAPLWAAFVALANASPACRGLSLGFVNPALYQIAGSSYLSNFHDVTAPSPFSGQANNNTAYLYTNSDNPNGLFPVGTGYDMATGLGSPIGNALGASLCALRAPVYSVSVSSPGSQTSAVGRQVSLQIHASDSGAAAGAALHYAAAGLPPGLTISAATGLITGKPTEAGHGTVTVAAGDQFANGAAVQFSWTVVKGGPPKVGGTELGGLATGKPSLKMTVTAGAGAPGLKTIKITLPSGLSFAHSGSALGKGTKLSGSSRTTFSGKAHGRTVTITFKVPQARVKLRFGKPAIVESRGFRRKALTGKLHKVKVGLSVTDASGKRSSTQIVLG